MMHPDDHDKIVRALQFFVVALIAIFAFKSGRAFYQFYLTVW